MKPLYFFITLCFCSPLFGQKDFSLLINNPTKKNLQEFVIEIPAEKLIEKGLQDIASENFKIIDEKGKEYIYQYLNAADFGKNILLVQINLMPLKSLKLFFKKGKHGIFSPKTFARFVPERYDDFAWENDKIAFRAYGPALEKTDQNGKGIDVWSKRTDKLILDKWYASKDYHNDKGEGCDMYKVGYSLGAGDIAPYINDSIVFPPNFSTYKILANGPLRSVFELYYNSFTAFDYKLKISKRISLDAGSQFNKIEATFNIENKDNIPAVLGIVRRHHAGINFLDEQNGIMTYWEPATPKDGLVGVACILPTDDYLMAMNKGHLLTPLMIKNNQAFSYFAGASWNKANRILSPQEWTTFVYEMQQKISASLQITFQ